MFVLSDTAGVIGIVLISVVGVKGRRHNALGRHRSVRNRWDRILGALKSHGQKRGFIHYGNSWWNVVFCNRLHHPGNDDLRRKLKCRRCYRKRVNRKQFQDNALPPKRASPFKIATKSSVALQRKENWETLGERCTAVSRRCSRAEIEGVKRRETSRDLAQKMGGSGSSAWHLIFQTISYKLNLFGWADFEKRISSLCFSLW